jgi:hypothetical protein
MARVLKLVSAAVRARAMEALRMLPEGWVVTFKPPSRTLDQNSAQWPILAAISEQLQWPVDGELVSMSDEEWKDVLTAAFEGERVRLARGVFGGVVMIGLRTSKMSKARFSEWLEFLHWFAAERGVVVYPDHEPGAAAPARRPREELAA